MATIHSNLGSGERRRVAVQDGPKRLIRIARTHQMHQRVTSTGVAFVAASRVAEQADPGYRREKSHLEDNSGAAAPPIGLQWMKCWLLAQFLLCSRAGATYPIVRDAAVSELL